MAKMSVHWRQIGVAAALFVAATFTRAAVSASAMDVKAVFTLNFISFVRWPAEAFLSPDSPLVIGVCGNAEMVQVLERTVAGEHVGSRPVQVRQVKDAAQAQLCHILYVAPGSEQILRTARPNRPILTVGETDAFTAAGGVIRFMPDRSRIKLQINLTAARKASLEISSQLLRIAEIIGGTP